MKATIQQVKEIRKIPETESIEVAEVAGRSIAVRTGTYIAGDFCVSVERPNLSESAYYPTAISLMPVSAIEGNEEFKVGISKQPWGDQLQLGPYDDALVIQVGTDVTCLINTKMVK